MSSGGASPKDKALNKLFLNKLSQFEPSQLEKALRDLNHEHRVGKEQFNYFYRFSSTQLAAQLVWMESAYGAKKYLTRYRDKYKRRDGQPGFHNPL